MPDPHTHKPEQTQTQNQQQEPVGLAVAAPGAATTSVIHGTGPGLVATDGFRPALTGDGHQVLVWDTPTPQERQLIAAARHGEPLPGVQTNHTTPLPVLPHDETEPVQVVYHAGRSGTEASQHPAEFARQLSRQYEALSYLTVDEYLKGRDLYKTNKRAPNSSAIETDRAGLEKQIVIRLVREYRFDPDKAEEKAAEAVQSLAALHEPDQSLQGTHQLTSGEIVWGNGPVNSSIGGQHKPGVALLDKKARAAQQAGIGQHYLNVRVVLCGNSRLASRIRNEKTHVVVDSIEHEKHVPRSPAVDAKILARELNAKYPELSHSPPQPTTTPTQPAIPNKIDQVKNILTAAFPKPAASTQAAATSKIDQVKNILTAAFPKPATPTTPKQPAKPLTPPTRYRGRNHSQNQIER